VFTSALQAQSRPIPPNPTPAGEERLDANYSLHLSGAFVKDAPFDVLLQGAGPRFETTISDPLATVNLILRKEGEKYLVTYAIGMRAPTVSSTKSANVEYRDASLTGSAFVQLGKPFTLATINGQALTLTVSQVKAE